MDNRHSYTHRLDVIHPSVRGGTAIWHSHAHALSIPINAITSLHLDYTNYGMVEIRDCVCRS